MPTAMTPSKIRKAVEKAGCSIEIEQAGNVYQVILDAPTGKLFKSSGCHCDAGLHGNGWQKGTIDWNITYSDAARVIEDGFLDCGDPECDMCHADNND